MATDRNFESMLNETPLAGKKKAPKKKPVKSLDDLRARAKEMQKMMAKTK